MHHSTVEDLEFLQRSLLEESDKFDLRRSLPFHLTLGVYDINKELSEKVEDEESDKKKIEDKDKKLETTDIIKTVNLLLADYVKTLEPTCLKFGKLNHFESRIVYIEVSNVPEIVKIRNDINALLKQKGIEVADERFTAHVTLFRPQRHSRCQSTLNEFITTANVPTIRNSPIHVIRMDKLRGC